MRLQCLDGLFPCLDISEVADYKFILVDTGAPVKNIFLMFRNESHPVFL